jgi:pyruvate dehydrogenase E1 component
MQRMYQQQENIFYYVTVMNENYAHPAMPEGIEEGIIRGMYQFKTGSRKKKRVQLLGSGTILREVIEAAELLEKDWNVAADIWSVTSFTELARNGIDVERWNRLHPMEKPRASYVEDLLKDAKGPAVAATDYVRAFADQIRPYMGDRHYVTLGTEGFGRSDLRSQLRKFFEVNRYYVVVAALKALADQGELDAGIVAQAIKTYKIDPEKPNPSKV